MPVELELEIRDVDMMIDVGLTEDLPYESYERFDSEHARYQAVGTLYQAADGSHHIYVELEVGNTTSTDIDKYAEVDVKMMVTLRDGLVNSENVFTSELIQVFARPGTKETILDFNYKVIPNIVEFIVQMTVRVIQATANTN